MVIDNAVTLMGSYDWTAGAARNSENLNLSPRPPLGRLRRPLARAARPLLALQSARVGVGSLREPQASGEESAAIKTPTIPGGYERPVPRHLVGEI
jgi:hypothetical protein